MQSHYRKQLVFSFESLNQVEGQYNKLKNRISTIKDEGELDEGEFSAYNSKFIDCLSDDLNTANAVTVLYDLIKDEMVNGHTKLELINSFDKVFSLDLINDNNESVDSRHDYIMSKIEERKEAKKNKNFELADKIRNDLASDGIILLDTREGTTYKIEK